MVNMGNNTKVTYLRHRSYYTGDRIETKELRPYIRKKRKITLIKIKIYVIKRAL